MIGRLPELPTRRAPTPPCRPDLRDSHRRRRRPRTRSSCAPRASASAIGLRRALRLAAGPQRARPRGPEPAARPAVGRPPRVGRPRRSLRVAPPDARLVRRAARRPGRARPDPLRRSSGPRRRPARPRRPPAVRCRPPRDRPRPHRTCPPRHPLLAAWIATRWLRRRMPAAMTIPGYDLFADEQRRARLIDLVRRLRGRPRPPPRRRPNEHVPEGHVRTATGRERTAAREHRPPRRPPATGPRTRSTAGASGDARSPTSSPRRSAPPRPPEGARVLAQDPPRRARRGRPGRRRPATTSSSPAPPAACASTPPAASSSTPTSSPSWPTCASCGRSSSPRRPAPSDPRPRVELQTDPPLGPLMRALVRRVTDAHVVPRLAARAAAPARPRPRARPATSCSCCASNSPPPPASSCAPPPAAEVRLRHGAERAGRRGPAGLRIASSGLPFLPDATLRRLRVPLAGRQPSSPTPPPTSANSARSRSAQLVRVRAAPGPSGHPRRPRGRRPARSTRCSRTSSRPCSSAPTSPCSARLNVRIDPDDVLGVRLAPRELALASARRVAVVAPDLRLALRVARVDHLPSTRRAARRRRARRSATTYPRWSAAASSTSASPHLRPRLPLWPPISPESTWLLAQVPKDSKDGGVRVELALPAPAPGSPRAAPRRSRSAPRRQ